MFEILQTETFRKWRSRLKDVNARAALARRLGRLKFGHFGDVKPVGEGISELRIDTGPGYRVYFQRRGDVMVLLLCGGDKGSQRRDVETAHRLAKEVNP